jgi:hypothetical protein
MLRIRRFRLRVASKDRTVNIESRRHRGKNCALN